MRKQVIIGLLIAISAQVQAHATTYHRFWRGVKRADLAWEPFLGSLNQIFIPATVATGHGQGMIAYEPLLLGGAPGLPDEVALVSYSDKGAYDALYSTDAGKRYQNLHWQYFDRTLSHSIVPEPFTGHVEIEHAYDLDPSYSGWMHHTTTVRGSFRRGSENSADFLVRAQLRMTQARAADRKAGISDRVILIGQDYLIEYVSASSVLNDGTEADFVIPIHSKAPDFARILPRQGVNLQF